MKNVKNLRLNADNRRLSGVVFLFLLSCVFSTPSIAQVTGTVFRDFNGDGVRQTNEPLVPGVTVNVYDASNALCATAVTAGASAPNYSAAGCGTGPVRVEFLLPSAGACAAQGIDYEALSAQTYGSSVQFVNGNSSNVNFALHYSGNYHPLAIGSTQMYVPCYVNGNPLGGGSSGTGDWFVGFPYTSSGTTPPPRKVNGTQLGATWGTAYSRQAGVIFTSAFIKRHVGLGPLGSGGIYMLTPSGSTFVVTPFYDMDANGYRTRAGAGAPAYGNGSSFQISGANNNLISFLGPIDPASGFPVGLGVVGTNAMRGLPASALSANYDPAAFGQVGKVGLGGMDISPDGRYLYVMNLYDRRLYRLELNDPYAPTSVVSVSSYALPSGVTCTNGVLRPFGVRFYRGSVYVGAVCSGENGGQNTVNGPTDLYAYVFRLNDATSGSAAFASAPVISYPLNYLKGAARQNMPPAYRGTQWYPWVNNTDAVLINPDNPGGGTYPSPMLTDIDFSDRGDLMMAFTDRGGHVYGADNYQHLSVSGKLLRYVVGGDLLVAGLDCGTGNFTLESNGSFVSSGQTLTSLGGVGNSQGPGGGEFFYREEFNNPLNHQETSQGSVSNVFGQAGVMATVMDPTEFHSGGTRRFSTTNGELVSGSSYRLYVGFPDVFGKANGLGDVSWGSPDIPIEVGNRVWDDANANGVQDAGEAGLAGVQVELYKETSPGVFTLIASAVTDANGNYYFSSASGTSTASFIYGVAQLQPNMSYELRFPTSVGGLLLTTPNNGGLDANADARDSDANAAGVVAFVTGGPGANNHSFDVGYSCPPLPCLPTTVVKN